MTHWERRKTFLFNGLLINVRRNRLYINDFLDINGPLHNLRNSRQYFWHSFCALSFKKESHEHFPKILQRISKIITFTH